MCFSDKEQMIQSPCSSCLFHCPLDCGICFWWGRLAPHTSPVASEVWTQGHLPDGARLSSDQRASHPSNSPEVDFSLASGESHVAPRINAESWHWDKSSGRSVPASTMPPTLPPSPYSSFHGNSSLPSVSLGRLWWLAAGFSKPTYMAAFPCQRLAVHGPSAVTPHWAPTASASPSLIETQEKSLWVVLLTQDIIRWRVEHRPERDTVKLREHYCQ